MKEEQLRISFIFPIRPHSFYVSAFSSSIHQSIIVYNEYLSMNGDFLCFNAGVAEAYHSKSGALRLIYLRLTTPSAHQITGWPDQSFNQEE